MSRIDSLIINNTEYRLNVNRISNLQTTINSLQTTINSLTNRIDSLEEGDSIGSIRLTLYEKNNNYCYITVQTSNVSNRNNIKYYTMSGNRNNHTEQNITSYVTYVTGNNNDFRVQVSTARLSSDDFGNFGWYNDSTLTNRWNIRAEVTDNFGNNISYKLFIDDSQQIEYYTVTFNGFDQSNASPMSVPEGFEITLPTSATKNSDSQYTYEFNGWKNNSTNTTYSPGGKVTIYEDTTFTAKFIEIPIIEYLVTLEVTNGTIINGSSSKYLTYGQQATWSIEPNEGYSLPTNSTCSNCTINGNTVTSDPVEYTSITCIANCIEDDTSYTYIGDDPFNGYAYVDLGLPSGTKWATMNVGANNMFDYGNYYMYGMGSRTYNSNDTIYTGIENPLDLSKDTANVVWGGDWHMPTQAQIQELIEYTTYSWQTNYRGTDINGGLFVGSNGKSVFFPACGYFDIGGNINRTNVGGEGNYWSSSPYNSSDNEAHYLSFSDGYDNAYDGSRRYGNCVRGVVG